MEPKKNLDAVVAINFEPPEYADPAASMVSNESDVGRTILSIAEETEKAAQEVWELLMTEPFTNGGGIDAADGIRESLSQEEFGVPVGDFSAEENEDIEEFLARENGIKLPFLDDTKGEESGVVVTGYAAEGLAEACAKLLDSAAAALRHLANAVAREGFDFPEAEDLVECSGALSDAAVQLMPFLNGRSPPSLDLQQLETWAAEVEFELTELNNFSHGAAAIQHALALSTVLPHLMGVFTTCRR